MSKIYILALPADFDHIVEAAYSQNDRCRFLPGVWLIRSGVLTSHEVIEGLAKTEGLDEVIAVPYDGVGGNARPAVVDKLNAWFNL